MTNSVDLQKCLSNVLATKVDDAQIRQIAESLRAAKFPVTGVDPCIYGICINYGLDGRIDKFNFEDWKVDGLGAIQEVDIMIDGIKLPERTNMRFKYHL